MCKESRALVGSIQKFSTEDGPGIRTTVFFKGCPLNCRWCHNPELINAEQELIQLPNSCIGCGYCIQICPQKAITPDEDSRIEIDRRKCDGCMKCVDGCYAQALKRVAAPMTAQEIFRQVLQDKEFYEQTGGGMTLSGGEILSNQNIVRELISLAENSGVGVCLDTSGFGDGVFLLEMALRDIVTDILFDIKTVDPAAHKALTGQSNDVILGNLQMLAEHPVIRDKIQIRMPLMAGVNDGEGEIEAVIVLMRGMGLRRATLLPYHDLGISKMNNLGRQQERFQPPSEERLDVIRTMMESEGITTDILGRV
ncbi:glycyl radical-activating protein [Hornefia porci]|uniref:Glycyl radical-activating protein n=1 Tax=Hornefia porci TaxID=2652292 RepID=A0A1Q9JKJ3_9FIRM|nr:glycyl-radical enzyme activating protein [Hornefia porci]OLR56667.1 glycyl radical-activating protein [Hornefia porci]